MKKILIMGLPGSGKTTLAKELKDIVPNCAWFNADTVRQQYDDWDFSAEGRIRQAERMKWLAENCPSQPDFVVCDFVAPTEELRSIFNADFVIWMNTIETGRYEDTNKVFTPPEKYDMMVLNLKDAKLLAQYISKYLLTLSK